MFEQRKNRRNGLGNAGSPNRARSGFRVALCEQGAVNRDLEIAKAVQKRLLPQTSLRCFGLLTETYYMPLHGIGGDYYDFVSLDRNRVGIAIGDVSGKGVGAALIMANLQASLRAHLLHPGMGPRSLVRSLNRLLYEASHDHVFASLFYGEYDPESRVLRYVNAGHHPPLVVRQNGDGVSILRLESDGVPVGFIADAVYEEMNFLLRPGDLFVAFTDGIIEAGNVTHEQWGLDGFEAVLAECAGKDPAQVVETILRGQEDFMGPVAAADDMTLVVASVERHSVAGRVPVLRPIMAGLAGATDGFDGKPPIAGVRTRYDLPCFDGRPGRTPARGPITARPKRMTGRGLPR